MIIGVAALTSSPLCSLYQFSWYIVSITVRTLRPSPSVSRKSYTISQSYEISFFLFFWDQFPISNWKNSSCLKVYEMRFKCFYAWRVLFTILYVHLPWWSLDYHQPPLFTRLSWSGSSSPDNLNPEDYSQAQEIKGKDIAALQSSVAVNTTILGDQTLRHCIVLTLARHAERSYVSSLR